MRNGRVRRFRSRLRPVLARSAIRVGPRQEATPPLRLVCVGWRSRPPRKPRKHHRVLAQLRALRCAVPSRRNFSARRTTLPERICSPLGVAQIARCERFKRNRRSRSNVANGSDHRFDRHRDLLKRRKLKGAEGRGNPHELRNPRNADSDFGMQNQSNAECGMKTSKWKWGQASTLPAHEALVVGGVKPEICLQPGGCKPQVSGLTPRMACRHGEATLACGEAKMTTCSAFGVRVMGKPASGDVPQTAFASCGGLLAEQSGASSLDFAPEPGATHPLPEPTRGPGDATPRRCPGAVIEPRRGR